MTIALVVSALVAVPAAAADSTVLLGYGTSGSKPVVQVKGTTGSGQTGGAPAPTQALSPESSGPSTLPFTGSDLALFMVAGVVLVGLGFGLRRMGRDKA